MKGAHGDGVTFWCLKLQETTIFCRILGLFWGLVSHSEIGNSWRPVTPSQPHKRGWVFDLMGSWGCAWVVVPDICTHPHYSAVLPAAVLLQSRVFESLENNVRL